jgi:hypothetical protein
MTVLIADCMAIIIWKFTMTNLRVDVARCIGGVHTSFTRVSTGAWKRHISEAMI